MGKWIRAILSLLGSCYSGLATLGKLLKMARYLNYFGHIFACLEEMTVLLVGYSDKVLRCQMRNVKGLIYKASLLWIFFFFFKCKK